VEQVLRDVPAGERCQCDPNAPRAKRRSLFSR